MRGMPSQEAMAMLCEVRLPSLEPLEMRALLVEVRLLVEAVEVRDDGLLVEVRGCRLLVEVRGRQPPPPQLPLPPPQAPQVLLEVRHLEEVLVLVHREMRAESKARLRA
jgi:hypothetical protein